MKTLVFATKEDAEARSRAEWEKVLGRPRLKGDVTEFLWRVDAADDGTVALVVPDAETSRLTKSEKLALAEPVLRAVET